MTAEDLENDLVEILVVEDSPTQAEELKYTLERRGFAVSVACNGIEALSRIRERKPTMVISDIVMPEMDGYKLCREIKDDVRFRNLPVILLTSLSDPRDVVKGLESGADNFITKPYEENYILSRIQYMLANKHLQDIDSTQLGVEVILGGEKYFIKSDRIQILNLLLSSYEAAIHQNGELVKAQSDLKAFNKQLEQANFKLREMDRLKSLFIASMSHELRTPLNSIIGFSSIILNEWIGPMNDEQKENLSIVLQAGKHLLALINDVIDVSKIEAGMIDPDTEEFDLYGVIAEATASLEKEIRDKGLDLRVEAVHQPMRTDRRRLLQCVLNLLSNAMKFTEKGAICVHVQGVSSDRGSVEISVEDTGIGIRAEDLPKLGNAFIRLDSPLKTVVPGTGLGLYLTRKLATEVLHGEVRIDSRYGEGSRFTLAIPALGER